MFTTILTKIYTLKPISDPNIWTRHCFEAGEEYEVTTITIGAFNYEDPSPVRHFLYNSIQKQAVRIIQSNCISEYILCL